MSYTTHDAYQSLRAARRALAKNLFFEAMNGRAPEGYILTDDPRHMIACDQALAVFTPIEPVKDAKRIVFTYSVDARFIAGQSFVDVLGEYAHAHGDVFNGSHWAVDTSFGNAGSIRASAPSEESVPSAVRMIVATACSYAPVTNFTWKPCDTDPKGKWHLYDGDRKLGAAWRISPASKKCGTLMGTTCDSLAEAKRQTELSAALAISSGIQEQLAGLGEEAVEELDAPRL